MGPCSPLNVRRLDAISLLHDHKIKNGNTSQKMKCTIPMIRSDLCQQQFTSSDITCTSSKKTVLVQRAKANVISFERFKISPPLGPTEKKTSCSEGTIGLLKFNQKVDQNKEGFILEVETFSHFLIG